MTRYVVAARDEIPAGGRKTVTIRGRGVVVCNVDGAFYAILDRCPHQGGSLGKGKLTGMIESSEPGEYRRTRAGEIIRCPWHGWEFDLKTGKSFCDARRWKVTTFETNLATGAEIIEGPYQAEVFEVRVEGEYVVIDA